jgi:mRNA-degrading endonuclease RelE of RelBE toxin-antitoxin system
MPVVIITDLAFDDIEKLDKDTRKRVYKAIESLSKGITRPNKLKGKGNGYKVKVGKYRIVWKYNKEGKIRIDKVKLRKNVYRKL